MKNLIDRYPVATAVAVYAAAVTAAFWRVWTGQILINAMSDQRTGYAFRAFAADFFRSYGSIPEWSPYLFGGMPFVANTGHGDTFYPTFLLRLLFPVDIGMTVGFLIHLVLAGTFTFLFLRAIGVRWSGAFTGGAAYMFSGQIISLVSPGHDGKMYVSALLPLALMFLYQAVRTGRWQRYVLFGITVGFSLLSPHFQLTYYLLMAAGFFWLFLVVFGDERPAPWWQSALWFGGALAVGFAVSAVQLLPFIEYIQFSPRGTTGSSSSGWEYATSWSMPPEELLNAIWPHFTGSLEEYWGRSFFKLHSEYIGAATLMLAGFAFVGDRFRRLRWFFVFLAAYGMLFAFGGYTPFYRLPYTVLPGISMTRAPSMIFFLVSFAAAILCGMGVDRVLDRETRPKLTMAWAWIGAMALAAALFAAGAFEGVARVLADPAKIQAVAAANATAQLDALRVLLFAAGVGVILLLVHRQKLATTTAGLALGCLVLFELWSGERPYLRFSDRAEVQFAADPVVRELETDSTLFRVLPVGPYSDNYLMVHRIRSVLGYHGNELHRYDELLGGKNVWQALGVPNVWTVLSVKYVATDRPLGMAGLSPVVEGAFSEYEGRPVYLYRYDAAAPFAYLVGAAVQVPEEQVLGAIWNERFDPRRLLIVPEGSGVGETTLGALPPTIETEVSVREVRPGRFEFRLAEPPSEDAFVYVSENYYPSWHARVDGREVAPVRAQFSMMAVPIPAGASEVELWFESAAYRRGWIVTLLALIVAAGVLVVGRRRGKV